MEERESQGTAQVGEDRWVIRFELGQVVYHLANREKRPGIVTRILLDRGRVMYGVEWGHDRCDIHVEHVLTTEFHPDYSPEQ